MKFIIKKNEALDIRMIENFWDSKNWKSVIKKTFPEISKKEEVKPVITSLYDKKTNPIDKKIKMLTDNSSKLRQIADAISAAMNEEWDTIKTITIDVGFSPIAPRFVSTSSFLLPCQYSNKVLFNISAHEMIHFLYFKKWSKLFPKTSPKQYNFPDPVWALSEIVVHSIAEDPRIKKITKSNSYLYDHWQTIKIEKKDLKEHFQSLYKTSPSFDDFIKDSWKEYQRLDKKYKLTKKLTT